MSSAPSAHLAYRRSRFSTQLPRDYLYSPSHYWVQQTGPVCRVGLTKFATRMLGEMVDHGFEVESGAGIEPGQIVGWVEGFKAIADVYCVGRGTFLETNLELKKNITAISKDPYRAGWLYQFSGGPDDRCMSVEDYAALLDKTIDKILAQEKHSD